MNILGVPIKCTTCKTNKSRKLDGLLEIFFYHMQPRLVEILLICVTTFSAAGELSRDQNSKPLPFWPKTVLDALTRKWIER